MTVAVRVSAVVTGHRRRGAREHELLLELPAGPVSARRLIEAAVSAEVAAHQARAEEASLVRVLTETSLLEDLARGAVRAGGPHDDGLGAPSPGEVSTAQVSTAEVSTAEVSTAEVSTAEVSTAEVSTAEVSTAEVSTAEVSTVEVSTVELSTAVETALLAFQDGIFKIFVGDDELTDDADVEVADGAALLFLRLVPLAGG